MGTRLNLATERIGAGRPTTSARSKRQVSLIRHHGRKGLIVGIRRLVKYLCDPNSPVDDLYRRTFAEVADRCGLAKRLELDNDVSMSMFTPELMREIIQDTIAEMRIDPKLGRVTPIDVPFSVVEGNGSE